MKSFIGLAQIPGLTLLTLLILPIILYKIHPQIGLAFIAFFIAFWGIKVLKGYFFLTRSFLSIQ